MGSACLEDITSSQTNTVETAMPAIVEAVQPAVEIPQIVPARLCYKGHSCEDSYNKQTEILDIIESDSLYYINGLNLKPAHKKMIQPGDVWKIALIEDIPSCCREHIGDAFFVFGFGSISKLIPSPGPDIQSYTNSGEYDKGYYIRSGRCR